jgi:hypothetical protein
MRQAETAQQCIIAVQRETALYNGLQRNATFASLQKMTATVLGMLYSEENPRRITSKITSMSIVTHYQTTFWTWRIKLLSTRNMESWTTCSSLWQQWKYLPKGSYTELRDERSYLRKLWHRSFRVKKKKWYKTWARFGTVTEMWLLKFRIR